MAGESEETVSETRSTEDILAETEELLSETEGGANSSSDDDPLADSVAPGDSFGAEADATARESSGTERSGGSRLAGLRPSLPSIGVPTPSGLSSFFSVRAFASLAAVLGVGYVGGGMVIPMAGSLLGMALVAFLVGVISSTRRYAEMATAGGAVGAVMAMISHLIAIVGGFGSRLVLVGLSAGVLSVLLGYYFGRDLRAGLTGDPSASPGDR